MLKKILIEGMNCEHCVNHVKEALSKLNGVTSVNVNLDSKLAVLEALQDVKDEDIKAAVDEVGYEVLEIE